MLNKVSILFSSLFHTNLIKKNAIISVLLFRVLTKAARLIKLTTPASSERGQMDARGILTQSSSVDLNGLTGTAWHKYFILSQQSLYD